MKKKSLALVLCMALFAVAIVGGSLAYFTDTDKEDNTFTVGGVKIDLIEQQRDYDENGILQDELVPFKDGKLLMPIVGSAQSTFRDKFGMADREHAQNYVDKIIDVKNTGASNCYVRVFFAVPSALQNGDTPYNASLDIIHDNWLSNSEGDWTDEIIVDNAYEINGINYKIWSRTYKKILKPDGTTDTHAYVGLYLDKNVDQDENGYTITRDGVTTQIEFDFNNGVTVPVFAQAVQAAGFENYEAAFEASGLPANPWATNQ